MSSSIELKKPLVSKEGLLIRQKCHLIVVLGIGRGEANICVHDLKKQLILLFFILFDINIINLLNQFNTIKILKIIYYISPIFLKLFIMNINSLSETIYNLSTILYQTLFHNMGAGSVFCNRSYQLLTLRNSSHIHSSDLQLFQHRFTLSDPQWVISFHKYQEYNTSQVLSQCQQIRINVLNLEYNNHPTIIRDISSVQFPYLKALSLRKNCIVSIESLNLVKMQNLVSLILDENLISSIKSLRCNDYGNIKSLIMSDNKIISLQELRQMKLNCLEFLSLQRNMVNKFQEIQCMEANEFHQDHIVHQDNSEIIECKSISETDIPPIYLYRTEREIAPITMRLNSNLNIIKKTKNNNCKYLALRQWNIFQIQKVTYK